jgi:hypothetical protein
MNWYLAKIVFRIICGEGNHTPQFDEQLRLIAASDSYEAFHKAKEVGLAGEEKIESAKQHVIEWRFVNIAELYRIDEWIHGAELYSRINETEDADMYVALTHRKAADIEAGFTHELLKLL